jgi:hypothetical protein
VSAVLSYRNLSLQQSGNRPNLASALPRINANVHPESLVVYWNNIGRKPARLGSATLFTVSEDGAQREKLGQASITGAGTNVFPGYSGQAEFSIDMQKFLGSFLVCTTYFDEGGKTYEQAFAFRLGTKRENEVALEELLPPNYKACR